MSEPVPPSPLASSAINLRRLFMLRNIALAAQGATVVLAVYGLGMPLPVLPLGGVIAVLAGLNVLTWLRLRRSHPVADVELFVQLLLDVAALTALLYLSGGSTNPFVLLYLLPITLSATTLPGAYTWGMAAVTVVCYSVLMRVHVPLPHVHTHHDSEFDLHVLGMWFGFVLSAGLIAYFAVKMSETLRGRDRALNALRENELRNERILALGTLAAGAAHELGTPLSTMAVLVKEMERDKSGGPEGGERLQILREQIERCKYILSTLSASAGEVRAEAGHGLPLDNYLDEVMAKWRSMRPAVNVRCDWSGARPAPHIVAEQTLNQAIINILNNAADASPDCVEVQGRWGDQELIIEVRDRGPGLAPAAQARVGKVLFTTKAGQGLGLGLFLAHATINRFGGSVHLYNREEGGACTRLVLPLTHLSIGHAAS